MGLIADYLEANRERAFDGDIDPCMIVNRNPSLRYRYSSLHAAIEDYSRADNDAARRRALEAELRRRARELEFTRTNYLVAEKAVLYVINSGNISVAVIADSLNELRCQMRRAYIAVSDALHDLKSRLGKLYVYVTPNIDEAELRLTLLNTLLGSVLDFLKHDLYMDTGAFRNVVSDCAKMIRLLGGQCSCSQPDKLLFKEYIVQQFSIKRGPRICRNCRQSLYEDIPYCLNCYERNCWYG